MSTLLEVLAEHGRQAEVRTRTSQLEGRADDLSHLSEEKRASLQRILSSVATTEGLESTLMEPMLAAKSGSDPQAYDYLASHAADERRHYALLCGYLKATFGYIKSKRTFADQVLYDRVFPRISAVFRSKPLYGFALLYCYERFSITFYSKLRAQAQANGAQNLTSILQAIEKDELRHVAGMDHLMVAEVRKQGGLGILDRQVVRAILRIMLLDVDMRPWALHNREVRRHIESLGIDPAAFTAAAIQMKDETLARLEESHESA